MKIPSPEEAQSIAFATRKPEIEALRHRVATAVTATTESKYWIDVQGVLGEVVDAIAKECEASGWATRIVHDQRDGSALVLSRK